MASEGEITARSCEGSKDTEGAGEGARDIVGELDTGGMAVFILQTHCHDKKRV